MSSGDRPPWPGPVQSDGLEPDVGSRRNRASCEIGDVTPTRCGPRAGSPSAVTHSVADTTARLAELVDAQDSKSGTREGVGVRFPRRAPNLVVAVERLARARMVWRRARRVRQALAPLADRSVGPG